MGKLGKLFTYIQKKRNLLSIMKSSLTAYNMYPEINGNIPVSNTFRAIAAITKRKLAAQPTVVLILSPIPKQAYSVWRNNPGSKTTMTITQYLVI